MKSCAGSCSVCSSMSNSANSIWRSVCRPLWKFFAASILSNSARGSGSPVSTCAVMCRSTSHSQQKFSMNWLGSSTASHSTPLMPDTSRSLTCVSMWCRPWPNSWNKRGHVVVREQRRLAVDALGEVADQVGDRRLQAAGVRAQPARAHVVHPGAAALAGARRRVEVELADQFGGMRRLRAVRARCGRTRPLGCHTGATSRRIVTSNRVSTILNRPAITLGAVKYCLTSCSLKA